MLNIAIFYKTFIFNVCTFSVSIPNIHVLNVNHSCRQHFSSLFWVTSRKYIILISTLLKFSEMYSSPLYFNSLIYSFSISSVLGLVLFNFLCLFFVTLVHSKTS
jgi:hypothetical protein